MNAEDANLPDVFSGLEIPIKLTPLEQVASDIMLIFAGRPQSESLYGVMMQREGDKTSERMDDGSIVEVIYRKEAPAGDENSNMPTRYKVIKKEPTDLKTGRRNYKSYSWEFDDPTGTLRIIEGEYVPGHPDAVLSKRDRMEPGEDDELQKLVGDVISRRAKRATMSLEDQIVQEEGEQ